MTDITTKQRMTTNLVHEHAEVLAQIRLLTDILAPSDVARAFVASLGSRQLEYRSAIGSYAIGRVLPDHPLTPLDGTYATICSICGWARMPDGEEDPGARHYAGWRRESGGLSHEDPGNIVFDLQQFQTLPAAEPTAEDWHRLDLVLRTPMLLAPTSKAGDLVRAIKTVVPSNKSEREVLLRILAYASILEAPEHPGYLDSYVLPEQRELPRQRFADLGYPIMWWRAKDGVRADAVAFWFPEIASTRAV